MNNTHQTRAVRTVREQIAERLRNEILSSQLEPEKRLREVELADRFGTGRGPVRDVLLQLTQEGALEYKPNSGVRVSSPPDGDTRKFLMSLRRQIELRAIVPFVRLFSGADEARMASILERMRRACEDGDIAEIAGADLALHQTIVDRGAGADLEAIWKTIAVRIRMAYSRLDDYPGIYQEHRRIVEAIRSGDVKASSAALEANLI